MAQQLCRILRTGGPNAVCFNCGSGRMMPPYMAWRACIREHGSLKLGLLYLCRSCAHKIKAGFASDLIHLAAIHEIQSVDATYSDHTLERTTNEESRGGRHSKVLRAVC